MILVINRNCCKNYSYLFICIVSVFIVVVVVVVVVSCWSCKISFFSLFYYLQYILCG